MGSRYYPQKDLDTIDKFNRELLGEPRQIIGPVYLWGNFPLIHVPKDFKHVKDDAWSTTPLRYNIRSKIPIEISRGLLTAIESQKTLNDYN